MITVPIVSEAGTTYVTSVISCQVWVQCASQTPASVEAFPINRAHDRRRVSMRGPFSIGRIASGCTNNIHSSLRVITFIHALTSTRPCTLTAQIGAVIWGGSLSTWASLSCPSLSAQGGGVSFVSFPFQVWGRRGRWKISTDSRRGVEVLYQRQLDVKIFRRD